VKKILIRIPAIGNLSRIDRPNPREYASLSPKDKLRLETGK
jgi:hypothetical protein